MASRRVELPDVGTQESVMQSNVPVNAYQARVQSSYWDYRAQQALARAQTDAETIRGRYNLIGQGLNALGNTVSQGLQAYYSANMAQQQMKMETDRVDRTLKLQEAQSQRQQEEFDQEMLTRKNDQMMGRFSGPMALAFNQGDSVKLTEMFKQANTWLEANPVSPGVMANWLTQSTAYKSAMQQYDLGGKERYYSTDIFAMAQDPTKPNFVPALKLIFANADLSRAYLPAIDATLDTKVQQLIASGQEGAAEQLKITVGRALYDDWMDKHQNSTEYRQREQLKAENGGNAEGLSALLNDYDQATAARVIQRDLGYGSTGKASTTMNPYELKNAMNLAITNYDYVKIGKYADMLAPMAEKSKAMLDIYQEFMARPLAPKFQGGVNVQSTVGELLRARTGNPREAWNEQAQVTYGQVQHLFAVGKGTSAADAEQQQDLYVGAQETLMDIEDKLGKDQTVEKQRFEPTTMAGSVMKIAAQAIRNNPLAAAALSPAIPAYVTARDALQQDTRSRTAVVAPVLRTEIQKLLTRALDTNSSDALRLAEERLLQYNRLVQEVRGATATLLSLGYFLDEQQGNQIGIRNATQLQDPGIALQKLRRYIGIGMPTYSGYGAGATVSERAAPQVPGTTPGVLPKTPTTWDVYTPPAPQK